MVMDHHDRHPLEPGAPLQAVRASAHAAHAAVVAAAIDRLVRDGEIAVDGSVARASGWAPRLNDVDRQLSERAMALLVKSGPEPPTVPELGAVLGTDVVPVLRFLEREGRVVPVEANRYYERGVLERLVGALREGMRAGQEYGPAELRDLLGFSRKFLIPFLEYCDRVGLTERRSGGRVRVGT
jgi:selenocysteine-specific elongation factor